MSPSSLKSALLLISNAFSIDANYGGVSKELAEKLIEQGWTVATTSAIPNRILRPVDMLATIWRKRREYCVAQIDVFSGSAFRWAETSAFTLRRLKKPFVLTLHGGNLPDFSAKHQHRVRSLLNSAQVVTSPSRYLLESMQAYKADIQLLPNPIDTRMYTFQPRMQVKPHILYMRALHKIYNPVLAVEMLENLTETHPEAHLVMAGPNKGDGSAEELQLVLREAGLSLRVKVVGAIPRIDVPATIKQADIFINTTNVDNTPISVIEAMASGLCIVSTNVGGIPYLLEHEHDALLVPPKDPRAMADAVRRILTEPGLAERLSRNARSKAEQFDWSNILPQWETLLIEVIKRHQHG